MKNRVIKWNEKLLGMRYVEVLEDVCVAGPERANSTDEGA